MNIAETFNLIIDVSLVHEFHPNPDKVLIDAVVRMGGRMPFLLLLINDTLCFANFPSMTLIMFKFKFANSSTIPHSLISDDV